MEMKQYHIKFESQSDNAGGSMPLGGHDIGCNVWVEKNSVYLYMAQSGALDEFGNMVKAGRLKLDFFPNPFEDYFSQELILEEGTIQIVGKTKDITTNLELWVDIKLGVLHIEIDSQNDHKLEVRYENWRVEKNAYPNADIVSGVTSEILFYHCNHNENHFEKKIRQENLEAIRDEFPNVQKNLIFGGCLHASGMEYKGKEERVYADLSCNSYILSGRNKKQNIEVYFHISHSGDLEEWKSKLYKKIVVDIDKNKQRFSTLAWWKQFWERSYIYVKPGHFDKEDVACQMSRNYQLFRFMLACNAYGEYPTKFNGGLFTVDPAYFGSQYGSKTPDERDWGGIIFTAQNQRHIYWPMLKSGDFDMMSPQFEFYFRLLNGAKARSKHFFGVENAACIPEQTDANGLSAYYGLYGLDYPIHVRYHYVTAVEFGYMMLKYIEATNETEVSRYIEFISTIVNFYDQMYHELNDEGKRILFPSTAQETYHKAGIIDIWGEEGRYAANYNPDEVAVTNPADVIYALRAILTKLLKNGYGTNEQKEQWERLKKELPSIPIEMKKGHLVIAPCEEPKVYTITNCEFPQLYGTFPYHEIGIGESNKEELPLAVDTYYYGWDEEEQLKNISWMHVGIFAARMGLVEDAYRYQTDKLKDSGRRFPAFWGPGHDYVPDHNWGGSGMTGLQEMLLQNFDGKIYLLPAWPKMLDVKCKLWVEGKVFVEITYIEGKISYQVSDNSREKDIVVCID